MENLSTAALIVLGLVAFNNYRSGTLPQWLRAKFFNLSGSTSPAGGSASVGGTGAGKALATIPQAYSGGGTGGFSAPVNGTVTSGFGPRGSGFHKGIDLAVPDGTPVHAARAGKVVTAGSQSGYGLVVIIDHGSGYVTKYAHLSRIDVHVGDDVSGGATLGLSGHTGDATGPHVHFEILKNGTAVDPAPYISTGGIPAVGAIAAGGAAAGQQPVTS